MEQEGINDLKNSIAKTLDLEMVPPGSNAAEVLAFLRRQIGQYLSHDMEKLVNIMYRLDIPEGEFHQAMALGTDELRASRLAELVLQRELKRLEFRKKYNP